MLTSGDMGIFSQTIVRVLGALAARTPRSSVSASALLALILIPSLSPAAIYKCTARDGSITYTDKPCPAETTTQYIDPSTPPLLTEIPQTMNINPALRETKSRSQPESIAILCANDEFRVWLKAQRHSLPERDLRTAKYLEISNLCRRALHLPVEAVPIAEMPLKRILGAERQAAG